ncbi:MAG: hypothetical protein WC748_00760 [Legionellales bacterium]|jgi:hypothetical protein
MKTRSISTPIAWQHSGHIYVVDLCALDKSHGWLLTAVLLHKKPFMDDALKFPQTTSAVKLKIKSPLLNNQTLCIQQALIDGKRVYAEVAFNDLKLLEGNSPNDMPNTEGELLEYRQVVVEYRSNADL